MRVLEIRVARAFGRIDVNNFLSEIDAKTFAEQAAYEVVSHGGAD